MSERPTPAVGQVWCDSGNEYVIVFLVNQEQYALIDEDCEVFAARDSLGLLMEVLRADTYVGRFAGFKVEGE